jgi:hypothetical protein
MRSPISRPLPGSLASGFAPTNAQKSIRTPLSPFARRRIPHPPDLGALSDRANKHKTRTRLPDCGPVAPMHSLALVPSRSESRSDQPNSPKEFSGRSQKKFYLDPTSYLTHTPPFRCTSLILHSDQIKLWELRLLAPEG